MAAAASGFHSARPEGWTGSASSVMARLLQSRLSVQSATVDPVWRRSTLGVAGLIASSLVAAGCLGASGSPSISSTVGAAPRSPSKCHLHAARTVAVDTGRYRLLVGLSPARPISLEGATAIEDVARRLHPAAAHAHFDVAVCSRAGRVLGSSAEPSVRLLVGGLASIQVRLRPMRPQGESEPPHFGANLALLSSEPVLATVIIAGERTRIPLGAITL